MTDEETDRQFLRLFEEQRPTIRSIVAKVLLRTDPGAVDDVIQVTFIKCRRCFQPALSATFRYWVLTAAKRNALNQLKIAATPLRHGILPENEATEAVQVPISDVDPLSLLLRKELVAVAEEAIRSLTAERAPDIFRLWLIDEMGYKEIAATLGIPIGTVMSSLNRSRPKVYAFIRARFGSPDPLTAPKAA